MKWWSVGGAVSVCAEREGGGDGGEGGCSIFENEDRGPKTE